MSTRSWLVAAMLCTGLSHLTGVGGIAEQRTNSQRTDAAGEKVLIEHVSPHRALTRQAMEHIEAGVGDAEFTEFVKTHFQLVLLTQVETLRLNKLNRSRMVTDRLKSAEIRLAARGGAVKN